MAHEKFTYCIDQCQRCAVICEHCLSECLQEDDIKMLTRCIEFDRMCAEVCRSTAALMSQGSPFAYRFCGLCAEICQACGDECARHSHMGHCKECSDMCYRCAEACRDMAGAAV
jgi:hypothetical protein